MCDVGCAAPPFEASALISITSPAHEQTQQTGQPSVQGVNLPLMPPVVIRLPLRLTPDASRVITRFFVPGDLKRSRDIIERILSFPEGDIEVRLAELERTFGVHHPESAPGF